MKTRFGFASSDGLFVDEHFGHARIWQIYDFDDDAEFVETRKIPAVCGGMCKGNFDVAYEGLKDCKALFVAKIGEPAAAFMIKKGVRVFEAAGSIDKLATAIFEQQIIFGFSQQTE